MFVGVDGCKSGWFLVALDDAGQLLEQAIYPHFANIVAKYKSAAPHILVDMPIGLPESGSRGCDVAARKVLSLRRSSVFAIPVRAAFAAETYPEACDINQRITGKRFAKQTWHIMPKIREVDALLRQDHDLVSQVLEAHPEVVFYGLAGQPMAHNKKTAEGYQQRIDVLAGFMPHVAEDIAHIERQYKKTQVMRDDIVDAYALAIAAKHGNLATLPEKPAHDAEGLPMQIVYSKLI